jgi:hypothetical protein
MNDLAITYIKKIQDLLDADEEILIDKNSFELKQKDGEIDFDVDMIKEMYDN